MIPTNVATYDTSSITSLVLSANTTLNQILFNAGASSYTINPSGFTLTLNGVGVTNNSGSAQTFNVSSGVITFNNSATSDNSTITNAGTLNYNNASSLGTSGITNTGTINVGATANASGATINNNSGSVSISGATTGVSIGSLSGAGNVTLGTKILTLASLNTSDTISGVISGTGSVVKTGTGTLTLSGINTYTGATTVNGGAVSINAANNLGTTSSISLNGGTLETTSTLTSSRPITLNAGGGTVQVDTSGNTTTLSGIISSTGSLTKTGTGTLTLSGANTYTGSTTVSDGILQGTTPAASALTVLSPGTYALNAARTVSSLAGSGNVTLSTFILTAGANNTSTTFSGVLSGTGGLTKAGTGTFTLSGVNTYTGATTVSGGSLVGPIGSASALTVMSPGIYFLDADRTIGSLAGTGSVASNGNTLTTGGNNTTTTFSGALSGVGGLTKTGTGTFTLSGGNSYGGATTVSSGILQGTTPAASALTVLSPGTYALNAARTVSSLAGSGNVTLSTFILTAGANNTSTTFSGVLSGTGGLTKAGTGTFTLSGVNTYTGATTVSGGSLVGPIGSASALTVTSPGIYALDADRAIGSLAGTGSVASNGNTLTTGGNNTSTTFSGVISGTGGVTTTGTGTLTVSGANTYTGTTTLGGTTLTLTGSLAGPITVNAAKIFNVNAATLIAANALTNNGTTNFNTTGTATNATVVNNSGATLVISGATTGVSIGSLSGAGNVTLGTKILTLASLNTSDTISGVISGTGSVVKTGTGTLTFSGINTYTGATTVNGGSLVGPIGSASALTVTSPGIYALDADRTIGSLAGTGSVASNGNTLTTGGNNTSTTFSGVISGTGGVTTTGTGTLTVSGANTYTGTTTLGGTTLTLTGSLAGPITVNAAKIFNVNAATLIAANALTNNGTTNFNTTGTATNATVVNNSGATLVISGATTGVSIGSLSGAGNVTLGTKILTLASLNTSDTISGVISGTGSVVKTGTGTLTLSGINTYTGATTVSGGAVSINAANNLGTTSSISLNGGTLETTSTLTSSRPITLNAGGGTVQVDTSGNTTTLSGIISSTGSLTKTGTGTLTLSGANTYTGSTTVSDGILQGTTPAASALTVLSPGTYALNAARTVSSLAGSGNVTLSTFILTAGANNTSTTFSGILSGTGGLTKAGTGTFTLSGVNTYTGATTVSGGSLVGPIGLASALTVTSPGIYALDADQTIGSLAGTGSVNVNGNTLTTGGNNTTTTFSGALSGVGGLTKTGTGTFTLSGGNSYGGATTVSSGILQGTTPAASALTVLSPGTYALNAARTVSSLAGSGNVTLSTFILTAGADNTSTTFSGVLSGTGGLTKAGTGTFTLSGVNTYTGATTVSGGIVSIDAANSLGTTSSISLNGGTLETTSTLTSSRPITLNAGAGTLQVDTSGNTTTLSGVISSTGALTKTGAGTLVLSAVNTYTGATTVSDGILQGSVPITTALTLGSAGIYDLDMARTIGALSGAGSVTLNGFTLTTGNASSTTFSGILSGTGGLTKAGTGTFTLSGVNTYSGATTVSNGVLQGAVPSGTALTVGASGEYDLATDQVFSSLAGSGLVDLGANSLTTGDVTSTAFSGVLSGTGGVTKVGAGTFTLSGANTYSGATTVNAGILAGSVPSGTALTVGSSGEYDLAADQVVSSLAGSGLVGLGSNTLTTGDATSTTFSGILSGTGGVTKVGAGTFTLSGVNTYSGATTVNAGILSGAISSGTALTVGASGEYDLATDQVVSSLAGSGLVDLGANALTTGDASSTTFSGVLSGTGGLTKAGTGTFTLSGVNTYSGTTTVSIGVLQGAVPSGTALTVGASGEYHLVADQVVSSLAGSGLVDLGANALTTGDASSTTFSGVLSGTGGVTKVGAGTFTLSGANTYSGETTVNAGILAGSVPSGTALTVGVSGEYDLATDQVISSLAGSGLVDLGANALTTGDATSTTFSGILSGTGGVTKVGAGTFTLSGANTYMGATTVNAGILAGSVPSGTALTVGASGEYDLAADQVVSSLSGSGLVGLGANTLTTGDVTSTAFSGILSGTGGVTKVGAGTFTLSGANTYSGATTVNAGILAGSVPSGTALTVGSSGEYDLAADQVFSSLAGSGFVDLGANSLTTGDVTSTAFSGVLSGTGGVTKVGAGTFTLSGVNTYSGATTVNAGILTGSVPSGTALTVGASGEYDLAADQVVSSLSGSGLVGLGANTLTTGNASSTTFSGILSGTGGVTKVGAGTFTLSGVNTYSGATTVNAGILTGSAPSGTALTVGASGEYDLAADQVVSSLSGSGLVGLGANTLTTGNASSATFSGILSGTGGVTKVGAGTFTMSGANTYSGTTTVNAGVLKLNGSISNSATTVNSGSNLMGTGTVGSLTINAGGYVTPGDYIGTLTTGTYTQSGTYNCEVQPTAVPIAGIDNDQIAVTGTANLGGILNIIPTGNYISGQSYAYTILTAAVVNGTFGAVTKPATFDASIVYSGANVILTLIKAGSFSQLVPSGNLGAIGSYIEANAPRSLVNQLDLLNQAQLTQALSQLSPTQTTQSTQMLTQQTLTSMETPFSHGAMDRLSQRLDRAQTKIISDLASFKQDFTQVFASKLSHKATSFVISQSSDAKTLPVSARVNLGKATFWLQGGAGHSSQDHVADPSGLGTQAISNSNYDTNIGLDYAITDSVKLGLTTGYGYSTYKMKTNGNKGTTNSGRIGVYGLWQVNPDWYVNGTANYGHHRFKGDRIMTVLPAVAHQKHSGNHLSGLVEVGRDIALPQAITLTPYMSGGAVYSNEGRYTETGAGVQNLEVNSRHATTLQGKAGAQLAHLWNADVYSFGRLGVTYRRALDSQTKVTASLAGQGGEFSVRTKNKARVMANPSIGATVFLKKDIYATLAYEGELGTKSRNHQGMVRVSWKF